MSQQRNDIGPQRQDGEAPYEATVRPQGFDDFVGQDAVKANLNVMVQAAKLRGTACDHILFAGPPGLGKTTLSLIIAREMGAQLHTTSGPVLEKKGDLAGILSGMSAGDVLFIDEIHRLNPIVEENLYPAMEDFEFDIVIGEGPHARSLKLQLPRFTLVGATTRAGLLTSPLQDRFGYVARMRYYDVENLTRVVERSARILLADITREGAHEIARRSRGTPRIANRLLRRVCDFALVKRVKIIDADLANAALELFEIDKAGFDYMDRKYLSTIIEKFGGGPVGVNTISAAIGEERDTIEDVVEPYLLQEGFIDRTPRGRIATERAYRHLGLNLAGKPLDDQGNLFDS